MKKEKLIQIIEEEVSTLLAEIYEGIADDIAAADQSAGQKTPRAIHKQKERVVDEIRNIMYNNSENRTVKVVGESPSPEVLEIYISQSDEGEALTSKFGAGEGLNVNSLNSILKRLVGRGSTEGGKETLSNLERFTREGRRISDAFEYHKKAGGMVLDNFEEIAESYPLGPGEGITLRFSWDEDTFNLLARARDAESSTLFPGSAGARQAASSWEPPKPGDVQYRWAGDAPVKDD